MGTWRRAIPLSLEHMLLNRMDAAAYHTLLSLSGSLTLIPSGTSSTCLSLSHQLHFITVEIPCTCAFQEHSFEMVGSFQPAWSRAKQEKCPLPPRMLWLVWATRGHLPSPVSKLLHFQTLAAINIAISSCYPFCLHRDFRWKVHPGTSRILEGQIIFELEDVIEPP